MGTFFAYRKSLKNIKDFFVSKMYKSFINIRLKFRFQGGFKAKSSTEFLTLIAYFKFERVVSRRYCGSESTTFQLCTPGTSVWVCDVTGVLRSQFGGINDVIKENGLLNKLAGPHSQIHWLGTNLGSKCGVNIYCSVYLSYVYVQNSNFSFLLQRELSYQGYIILLYLSCLFVISCNFLPQIH